MIRAVAVEPEAGEAPDTVVLDYESRYRRRGRLVTETGEAVFLDLPEAMELPDGGALRLEDGRRLAIRAAAEPVAVIRAGTASLPRLAWHIGNRHTPAEIGAETILIRRDHVLEAMVEQLGGEVSPAEAPFRPERGAYGHGRTHGHSHGPADHDPNAAIPHRHG